MSSSSSSECDCDDYCHYANYAYATPGRTPFYTTMGHPLIYYAQVQQPAPQRPRTRRNKSGGPNCFVKAFRWYTQEHVPPRNEYVNAKTDVSGFASWLDNKYDEFVRSSEMDQIAYRLKLKQTSTMEAERVASKLICEPCTTKRFARKRSPWRKRRSVRSKDRDEAVEKSNQSFEYILKPKDLTRPASECCHHASCTMKSNITVTSEQTKKTTGKSQSLTSIHKEKEKIDSIDITLHEGAKIVEKGEKSETILENRKQNDKSQIERNKSVLKRAFGKDIACQCPEENVLKIDGHTQCESIKVTGSSPYPASAEATPSLYSQVREKEKRPERIKSVRRESVSKSSTIHQTIVTCKCPPKSTENAATQFESQLFNSYPFLSVCYDCQPKCTPLLIEEKPPQTVPLFTTVVEKQEPKEQPCCNEKDSLLIVKSLCASSRISQSIDFLVNNTAQTSDHSIRFVSDPGHGYPLFMKIVCADSPN